VEPVRDGRVGGISGADHRELARDVVQHGGSDPGQFEEAVFDGVRAVGRDEVRDFQDECGFILSTRFPALRMLVMLQRSAPDWAGVGTA